MSIPSGYLLKMMIEHATGGQFKGTKANTSALPATGNKFRDIWNVGEDLVNGDDYMWDGEQWIQLTSALDLSKYAKLASPTFTGTPKAPTASTSTNTTQIATTAFVHSVAASYAPLASPEFSGTPTAPTATAGTDTTQIATTAFVKAAIDKLITDYGLTIPPLRKLEE